MYGSYVRTYSVNNIYIYIYINVCVCVCVRERECVRFFFPSLSQPYQRLVPLIPSEFTEEYSATARRAAVTRVHGGENLNCTSQIRAIFFAPCTAYRQLECCVQSLLDRLCKNSKFQVRFRPDKPNHSLVRPILNPNNDAASSQVLFSAKFSKQNNDCYCASFHNNRLTVRSLALDYDSLSHWAWSRSSSPYIDLETVLELSPNFDFLRHTKRTWQKILEIAHPARGRWRGWGTGRWRNDEPL
jgi:hypothetical protein